VPVEGLAVAVEALPPFKCRLPGSSFGGLATAGELGAGFCPVFAASGRLGGPVLVPGVICFQGRLLCSEEVGKGVQGLRGLLVAVELGLDGGLPLVYFGLGGVFQLTGNVRPLRAGGSGPRPVMRRGLRVRYVSGCGRVLGQKRREVVWIDPEGLELADVVADLAVAVDLGVVEVRAEVTESY
jgi:hypothetical protein